MAKSFSERLSATAAALDMTPSDLARWFDRPRATVNTWLNGRTPAGPAGRVAWQLLELLDKAARRKSPVPATLTGIKRAEYIRGMADDARRHAGLSSLRAAV